MNFPRVLIFGQPFNNFSGGGITLSNLFRGWPKNRIAVTFIGHGLVSVTTDICDTYYQLGMEEHRWLFPLNLIQRKFESGLKSFNPNHTPLLYNKIQGSVRYKIINRIFFPFLRWTGIFYILSGIHLSERFKQWLDVFRPELIYIQASTRETVNFAIELCDYLNIPSVIHVMDDWPSTISSRGILKDYWSRRINAEFKLLLDKISLHLSISEAMSREYKERYNKDFRHFHNPIDVSRWLPATKKDFSIDIQNVTVLYSGRIGKELGIGDSLLDVAEAIDSMNSDTIRIRFHIQTPTRDRTYLDRLLRYKCVVENQFAAYEKIPEIFSQADILLLAYDFDKKSCDYLKLSMPTKASEYMISGTPVLVYCPEETAVASFFLSEECGYCVTKRNKIDLIQALDILTKDIDYRKRISQKAVNLALKEFESENVRNKFQNLLCKLTEKTETIQM